MGRPSARVSGRVTTRPYVRKSVDMRIRKGDTVKVVSGKDRGKTGKVEKVFPKVPLSGKGGRVVVSEVNVVKKHVKPREGEEGGIVEKTLPIDVSNVMLICPQCGKPTRVGYKIEGDKKWRVCKKCGAVIE